MKRSTAAVSKITRPTFQESLPRKRLFRLLDLGRKKPIIWVSGPPGSGKTTAVGQYVGIRKIPCVWYRLDEGDADFATFFHYLGIAARRAVPGRRKPLPALTPEHVPDIAVFTRRYFEEMSARLDAGTVLVFDDLQRVPGSSPFIEILREGLSCLPGGMNAVLISREDPHPALSRMRANGLMEVIGWQALRLTHEETERIVRLRRKGNTPAASVRYLHSRTDGWAAGLMLLLEKSETGGLRPRKLNQVDPKALFDYFASEVFVALKEEMRTFLLKAAFLPVVTGRMAERVTGHQQAGQILAFLNRQNYFTEKLSQPEPTYRLHSLFREFLLARSSEALPAGEILRIRKSAAEVLEESGNVEESATLLREANAWDNLARLILVQAGALVKEGRSQTLLAWLNALPREVVEREPWLTYWTGVCRLFLDPGGSRQCFDDAFREFRARQDVSGTFLAWSGFVESVFLGFGTFKLLDDWFAALDGLLEECGGFPSEEIEARVTITMIKGLAIRLPPNYSARESWADRALEVARKSVDAPWTIELLSNLAGYRILRGDLPQAEEILDPLAKLMKRSGVPPLARLFFHWAEAAYANLTARHNRCMNAVSEGLDLARASGVHVMDTFLMGAGALSSLNTGDVGTAERFHRAKSSSPRPLGPLEISENCYIAAWIALYRGEMSKALAHAEQGVKLNEEVGFPIGQYLCCLESALILHNSGDFDRASLRLAQAERIGAEQDSDLIRFACLLMKASFALDRGNEGESLASLREGLRIGRERGFASLYLYRPQLLAKVAAKALEAGIEVQYAKDLIRRNALAPESADMASEEWPWPLKIHTLGRFEVIRDGKLLAVSPKTPRKPLMMLKALIALGGEEVGSDRITDVLWPDADGDMASKSFSVTLYRLRCLLGREKALLLRDGLVTLDRKHCWVDAWALQDLLGDAPFPGTDGRMARRTVEIDRAAHKALALYRGPFLPGDSFWPGIGVYRERLRGRFLRFLESAGRLREAAGQWENAAECYRSGLEADDLAEEFYQRLMLCCLRLGRIADGLVAYRRCKLALSSVLGVNPSQKTEAIYRSLLSA